VARGWDASPVKEYILSADLKIWSNVTTSQPLDQPSIIWHTEHPTNKERLFIHWDYHPNDTSRHHIRSIYTTHCNALFSTDLGIKQTTVAYSPKAKLHQAHDREASKLYLGELS